MGMTNGGPRDLDYPERSNAQPVNSSSANMVDIFGALQVDLMPLQTFLGDILVNSTTQQYFDVNQMLGGRCIGFILTAITYPPIYVSINGGGFRQVSNTMSVDGAAIKSIQINPGAGSCILQLNGI